jgi:hypothetical protein
VRDDLAAADAAVGSLVRALGGSAPTATVTATARYDEPRGEVAWEVRHTVAGSEGVRLARIESRPFRSAGPPGRSLSLAYAAGDEALRPAPPGEWLELGPSARSVSIVAAWADPAPARPIRSTLRSLTLQRLTLAPSAAGEDALVAIVLAGHPGIDMPLAVGLPPPTLARVTVPRHALYFASGPGRPTSGPEDDAWIPAEGGAGPLEIDLVPRTFLLRNQAVAGLRPYLFRPNPLTLAVVVGLAALTLVLARRPRTVPPENR